MKIEPKFFSSLDLIPSWDGEILPDHVISPKKSKILNSLITWAVFLELPNTSPVLVGYYNTQEECENVAGMLEMLRG